jgi:hypothetical protein
VLGAQANNNDFFKIIGINEIVFLIMIICGAFLMLTASLGWTASATKNHCLAFVVSPSPFPKLTLMNSMVLWQ